MYYYSVAPIAKGIPQPRLTYRSSESIPIDALVTIPYGNRTIHGVVLSRKNLRQARASLRSSGYTIKKIASWRPWPLAPAILAAAKIAGEHFVYPLGTLLATILPKTVTGTLGTIEPGESRSDSPGKTPPAPQVIMQTYHGRLEIYRDLVAHSPDHLFVITCPSQRTVRTLAADLRDQNLVVAVGSARTAVTIAPQTQVLVTTPTYASHIADQRPRAYIIEHESSTAYYRERSPFFDWRYYLERLATERSDSLYLADTMISLPTFVRISDDNYQWHQPPDWKFFNTRITHPGPAKPKPASPKIKTKKPTPKPIEPFVARHIKRAKGRVVVFSLRKGYATTLLCRRCGQLAHDPDTGVPYRLYTDGDGNRRFRNRLHQDIPAFDQCQSCRGEWLEPFGFGIEQLTEQLGDRLPERPLFIIDKDTTPTITSITDTLKRFRASDNGILVCTHLALDYLEHPETDLMVIPRAKRMLLPARTYSHSQALSLLARLTDHADQVVLGDDLADTLAAGGKEISQKTITDELAFHHTHGLPPTTTHLQCMYTGGGSLEQASRFFMSQFAAYHPIIRDHITNTGKKVIVVDIYIDHGESTIRQSLYRLGPNWVVHINNPRAL